MKTVLLLAGGSSNEREVSLRSGDTVEKALVRAGHKVLRIDPANTDFDINNYSKNVDVAFIALHGAGGEDGTIQQQLHTASIPFTTSGIEASRLCWNKWTYKQFLIKHDFPVSRGILVTEEDLRGLEFSRPFVLKPIEGGSTIDVVIAREPTEDNLILARKYLKKYSQMLLEEVIEGPEVTVVIMGETALPVVEIIPPPNQEFDYTNKYNGASQEIVPPLNITKNLQIKVQDLALRIHKLAGCAGMSRTDIIIDKSGHPYILETNTIPGLSEQSLLPKATAAAGLNMEQVVSMLI